MVGVWGTWGRSEPLLWVKEMVRSQGFGGWGARSVVSLGANVAEAICAAVVEYLLMIHGASARTTMSPKPANTIPCFSERLTSPKKLFGTPFQTLPFNGSVASSDEFPTR